MPTTILSIGPVHTLTQNEVYALPARAAYIFSNAALEVSNESAFTSSQAIAADTAAIAAGAFVRCTTGAAIVRLSGI